MVSKKFALLFIEFLLLLSFVALAKADIVTDEPFSLSFSQGTALSIDNGASSILLTVYSGTLNGTATLTTDSNGGTLTVTPTSSGSITPTSNTGATIMINGANSTGVPFGFGAAAFTITWGWTGIPTLPVNPFLPGIQIGALMQYLWNRDFVGFILACYVSSMGEWFFVLLGSIIGGALYIRTKNLAVLGVAWILTGAIFIPVFAIATPVIVVCFVLGFSALLYKLYMHPT